MSNTNHMGSFEPNNLVKVDQGSQQPDMKPFYLMNGIRYCDWVSITIQTLDEKVLDSIGEYVPGMPNSLVDAKLKALLFAQWITEDSKAAEAFSMTSSTTAFERLQEVVDEFNLANEAGEVDLDKLFDNLVFVLADYMGGC